MDVEKILLIVWIGCIAIGVVTGVFCFLVEKGFNLTVTIILTIIFFLIAIGCGYSWWRMRREIISKTLPKQQFSTGQVVDRTEEVKEKSKAIDDLQKRILELITTGTAQAKKIEELTIVVDATKNLKAVVQEVTEATTDDVNELIEKIRLMQQEKQRQKESIAFLEREKLLLIQEKETLTRNMQMGVKKEKEVVTTQTTSSVVVVPTPTPSPVCTPTPTPAPPQVCTHGPSTSASPFITPIPPPTREKDEGEKAANELARQQAENHAQMEAPWVFTYEGKEFRPSKTEVRPRATREETKEALRDWARRHPEKGMRIKGQTSAGPYEPSSSIPAVPGSTNYKRYVELREKAQDGHYPREVGIPPREDGYLVDKFSGTYLRIQDEEDPNFWLVPPRNTRNPRVQELRERYEEVARIVGWPIISAIVNGAYNCSYRRFFTW